MFQESFDEFLRIFTKLSCGNISVNAQTGIEFISVYEENHLNNYYACTFFFKK
jgi:hypothetical protein